ncbi:hypothetical protein M3Y96_00620000 [Aphelenchoides besseyi]|nr:hypothetical protein M3Y96_00620000 [Aphelenchoides besseyi]
MTIEYEDQRINSSQVFYDCDTTGSCSRLDGINTNYLLKCCSIDLCNSPFINESTVTGFPPLTTSIPDYPTLLTTPSSSSCVFLYDIVLLSVLMFCLITAF